MVFEDWILVVEHAVNWHPKGSRDLKLSILAITGQNGRSERLNTTIRLVMLSPCICMIIPFVFFQLLLLQTISQHIFIVMVLEGDSWGSITLREQYLKL